MGIAVAPEEDEGVRLIAQNRRARHDYEVIEHWEAGIALLGSEVKSLRDGRANLKDSYAVVQAGEVVVHHLHISPYEAANRYNHDPERPRKLLLHRAQIRRLAGRVEQQGLTLVPLRLYFRHGMVKVELAMVRGKKQYDKRQDLATRQAQRDVERALKDRTR